MLKIPRAWVHKGEREAVHFVITAAGDERHVKLTRTSNAALYDFIVEHAVEPTEAPASN